MSRDHGLGEFEELVLKGLRDIHDSIEEIYGDSSTKRERYAAAAMQGFLAGDGGRGPVSIPLLVSKSFEIASAMIAAEFPEDDEDDKT